MTYRVPVPDRAWCSPLSIIGQWKLVLQMSDATEQAGILAGLPNGEHSMDTKTAHEAADKWNAWLAGRRYVKRRPA